AARAGARRPHDRGARGGAWYRLEHARRADRYERERRLLVAVNVPAKKTLGQHFLVDENILGVIGRLADLRSRDVVLEVGPGLGILTAYLADRVARVHAIEI